MSTEKKIGISNGDRAHVLVQAMPYIKKWAGETIVVKYGGNAMINPELKEAVMNDIVLMQLVGINVVLVHGGGPEISAMLKKIASAARTDCEEFLGCRVNLQCWVKVKADWRDNEFMLNNFGFKQQPNR